MISIEIHSPDLNRLLARFPLAPNVIKEEINEGMVEAGEYVRDMARMEAPQASGRLANSIDYQVIRKGFFSELRVYSTAYYARFVEMGTYPHFPPPDKIQYWADIVKGEENVGWPIAMAIFERGLPANPFMERATSKSQARVDQIFHMHLDRALERIARGEK